MAANLNPSLKRKQSPFLSQPYFRKNTESVKTKRIKRKIKIKPKHIIISFFLIAGLFFAIQQTYMFLITWDRLEVDKIEIRCSKPELKNAVQNLFRRKRLGNLLLLDINQIRKIIKSYTWVKDVHVKKIFPSAVSIEITERTPIAIIKKEQEFLVDKDRVLLQIADPSEQSKLPLLTDERGFESGFEDKFELALNCLESLSPGQRSLIKTVNLSKYRCVSIKLRQNSPWLILGEDDFSVKIQEYLDRKPYFAQFGELKNINLRFKDRYILTPIKKISNKQRLISEKEEADA